jgi:hypothetical protein
VLELDADSESPVGSIRRDDGTDIRFDGWLGLAVAIDRALTTHPPEREPAEQSSQQTTTTRSQT